MNDDLTDLIARMRQARDSYEAELAGTESFRALQQLDSRNASGESMEAVQPDALRRRILAELENNADFAAYRRLDEALGVLEGREIARADPMPAPAATVEQDVVAEPGGTAESESPGVAETQTFSAAPEAGAPETTPGTSKDTAEADDDAPVASEAGVRISQVGPAALSSEPADAPGVDATVMQDEDRSRASETAGAAAAAAAVVSAMAQAGDGVAAAERDGEILDQEAGEADVPGTVTGAAGASEAKAPEAETEADSASALSDIQDAPTSDAQPAGEPTVDVSQPGETFTADHRPPSEQAPLPADDLGLIREVDQRALDALEREGLRTFAQIAGLTAADVARLSQEPAIGRRISSQSWIEQAAILASGGTTLHALRLGVMRGQPVATIASAAAVSHGPDVDDGRSGTQGGGDGEEQTVAFATEGVEARSEVAAEVATPELAEEQDAAPAFAVGDTLPSPDETLASYASAEAGDADAAHDAEPVADVDDVVALIPETGEDAASATEAHAEIADAVIAEPDAPAEQDTATDPTAVFDARTADTEDGDEEGAGEAEEVELQSRSAADIDAIETQYREAIRGADTRHYDLARPIDALVEEDPHESQATDVENSPEALATGPTFRELSETLASEAAVSSSAGEQEQEQAIPQQPIGEAEIPDTAEVVDETPVSAALHEDTPEENVGTEPDTEHGHAVPAASEEVEEVDQVVEDAAQAPSFSGLPAESHTESAEASEASVEIVHRTRTADVDATAGDADAPSAEKAHAGTRRKRDGLVQRFMTALRGED